MLLERSLRLAQAACSDMNSSVKMVRKCFSAETTLETMFKKNIPIKMDNSYGSPL